MVIQPVYQEKLTVDYPCDHTRSGVLALASRQPPRRFLGELIPVVDKPTIQYVVEEAVEAGIREILIIISKGKEAICSHFESNPKLETLPSKKASMKPLEAMKIRVIWLASNMLIKRK